MKPSVLHVTPYYPPDRIGGVGEVARIIHEGLLARGYRSAVLSSGRTGGDPKVRRVGRTPARFALLSWLGFRHARKFDVLHVHHGEGLLLLFILRLLGRRPRILLMLHVDLRRLAASEMPHTVDGQRFTDTPGASLRRRVNRFLRGMLDRLSLRLCHEVVVETEALVAELDDLVGRKPVYVVPYGLETPGERQARPESGAHLLYVGTPGLRKRTHLLPLVLGHVREAIPDASLRIVGFHTDVDRRLLAEAERLHLTGAIQFEGPLSYEQTQGSYSSGEVLVLPSAYEGLPMVLLEAMRAKLPAVATAVSGHPEAITDGVDGYLVPLDNPSAMADRCIELLLEPDRREAMGEAAAGTVRDRFSVDKQLARYIDVYSRLAAGLSVVATNGLDGR